MAFLDIFGSYYFKTNLVLFTITNFFAACEECLKVLIVITKFAKYISIVAFFYSILFIYFKRNHHNTPTNILYPLQLTFILEKNMTKWVFPNFGFFWVYFEFSIQIQSYRQMFYKLIQHIATYVMSTPPIPRLYEPWSIPRGLISADYRCLILPEMSWREHQ